MHVELKSLAVEEERPKSVNLWTSGGSKKLTRQKSKSISTSKNFKPIIVDKVRRNSMMAFGARTDRDGNQGVLSRCTSESKILIKDDLQDANEYFAKREGELTQALSRTQMELEETQVMFEQAVGLGEQLRGKIRGLNEKLSEQIDLNSLLEKQVHFHKEANDILTISLDEARKHSMDTQKVLNEVNESTNLIKIELDQEKAYSSMIHDGYIAAQNDFDSDLKSALEALEKRLEYEKAKLADSREETVAAKKELRITEDRLSLANSKLAVLERQLVEKESIYNEMVLALTAEKGTLETENDALAREIKIVEDHLKEINERLRYYQRRSVFLDPLIEEGKTLADEITMRRQRSCSIDVSSIISYQEYATDRAQWISQILIEHTEGTQIPEIIQRYLQITAMAVQLHFPEIKDVTTNMLIENVINSPFYLYYDLMMIYMRKIKHGLAEEDAKEDAHLEAERDLKSTSEQSNFLAKFFWLKQGKDKTSGSKHRNREKSLVAINPLVSRPEKHQISKSLKVAKKSKEVSL